MASRRRRKIGISPGSAVHSSDSIAGALTNCGMPSIPPAISQGYLNSVMTPPKTVCFKEGVMLVEEVKAPKATGTVEARLDELEDKTFRYGTVVYRSLDAHHFMNLELEKKVEEYKKRLEDLEDRYKDVINKWEKFQCFMWDVGRLVSSKSPTR